MNKTKSMITGFALFAAFLMMMTTCMARPVNEKTSMDAVDDAQQEAMNLLETLKMKISKDRKAMFAIGQIEQARTEEKLISLKNLLLDADPEQECIIPLLALIIYYIICIIIIFFSPMIEVIISSWSWLLNSLRSLVGDGISA